jgi:hypothetical protein
MPSIFMMCIKNTLFTLHQVQKKIFEIKCVHYVLCALCSNRFNFEVEIKFLPKKF